MGPFWNSAESSEGRRREGLEEGVGRWNFYPSTLLHRKSVPDVAFIHPVKNYCMYVPVVMLELFYLMSPRVPEFGESV